MAKVLLIESDSVFAAVLADRLHVIGHEVSRLAEGAQAAAKARDEHADLVVLSESPNAGLAVAEALRSQAATRSVPILMLSDRSESVDRVAALRAGVDDYVSRPCDLEELLLRLERLLANRTAALQLLQGDLGHHPPWAVLQYLNQSRKSGVLRLHGPAGAGFVELQEGAACDARWQGLRGREALLALLSLEEGGFRFDPSPPGALPAGDSALRLQELLLDAAWIKDELGKRRHHLPATGQPLHTLISYPPEVDEDFVSLPLRRVFDRVLGQPGVRLFDLIADEAEAPISTRLATALLVEGGAVAMQTPDTEADLQNTREISSAMLFDLAVEDLMAAAKQAGFAGSTLPYLLLVEPEVWPALRRLLTQAPVFRQNESLRRLAEQTELRQAGSATLAGRLGEVSLHVQALSGPVPPQLNAAIGYCAGILVWVRDAGSGEALRAVLQRLETGGPPGAAGMVVAGGEAAGRQVSDLVRDMRRWRSAQHEPKTLLGVLRLLHPPDAA